VLDAVGTRVGVALDTSGVLDDPVVAMGDFATRATVNALVTTRLVTTTIAASPTDTSATSAGHTRTPASLSTGICQRCGEWTECSTACTGLGTVCADSLLASDCAVSEGGAAGDVEIFESDSKDVLRARGNENTSRSSI
jgi:hypothetical protein